MSECNHLVAIAASEYYPSVLTADDDGKHIDSIGSFDPFKFCPLCGEDVTEAAQAVLERIIYQHTDDERRSRT